MPTPKEGYHLADGSRVPGTTTVIGRFKDSGGLIHWAWTEGREGRDYRVTRDNAANSGTIGHEMVERHIKGEPIPEESNDYPVDVWMRAKQAFSSYLDWERHTKLKVIATEVRMVSERYRYGGTLDAVGEIDGKLCLLDWKTGGVYGDTVIPQLAAYINLWNEHHPDAPITGGAHIGQFSKTEADFTHRYFADVSDGWEAFKRMRELYDIVFRLKKRAA